MCVRVCVYLYFTSNSVFRRLSPIAEAYPFRGAYPCPQVWRGSRGKSCPTTLLGLTLQDNVCFAHIPNSRQTCCLWCQVSPVPSGMAQSQLWHLALLYLGIKPTSLESPVLEDGLFTTVPPGKPISISIFISIYHSIYLYIYNVSFVILKERTFLQG